jgi:hypothetical protein
MVEIPIEFHPICSHYQLIMDLKIELEHALEIDRFTMLINISPTWMQQPPSKFGDWIYPCNTFNVDPFMELTRYSKVIIFPQA